MRTLQILIACPWPVFSGGHIRDDMVARAAASLGPFLCLGLRRAGEATDLDYRQVPNEHLADAWSRFHPTSPTLLRLDQQELEWIVATTREFNPDVVIIEGIQLFDVAQVLRPLVPRLVFDYHNIESALAADNRRSRAFNQRVLDTVFAPMATRTARKLDRLGSHLAEQTWVCSADDADALVALGGKVARPVANPIPDNSFLDIEINPERYASANIVYCGQLTYSPNVAAVKELALKVMPEIYKTTHCNLPVVAGRSPSRFINQLALKGYIDLHADPDSMKDFVSANGYTILPIRYGSGTRIKALEAMAAGLVIISTAKAVEGLDLIDGTHFIDAETPKEMARALQRLLADPSQAAQIAQNARQFVRSNYTREAITSVIVANLTELMSQSSTPVMAAQ